MGLRGVHPGLRRRAGRRGALVHRVRQVRDRRGRARDRRHRPRGGRRAPLPAHQRQQGRHPVHGRLRQQPGDDGGPPGLEPEDPHRGPRLRRQPDRLRHQGGAVARRHHGPARRGLHLQPRLREARPVRRRRRARPLVLVRRAALPEAEPEGRALLQRERPLRLHAALHHHAAAPDLRGHLGCEPRRPGRGHGRGGLLPAVPLRQRGEEQHPHGRGGRHDREAHRGRLRAAGRHHGGAGREAKPARGDHRGLVEALQRDGRGRARRGLQQGEAPPHGHRHAALLWRAHGRVVPGHLGRRDHRHEHAPLR